MSKKKKIIILFILILIVILIIRIFIFSENYEKNVLSNQVLINDNGSIGDYRYNEIEIKDSSLVIDFDNANSQVVLTIKNDSDHVKYVKDISILMKDKKGKIVASFMLLVDKYFESMSEYCTSVATDVVIEDVYYVEYQIN